MKQLHRVVVKRNPFYFLRGNWTLMICISLIVFSACKKEIDKPLVQEESISSARPNTHGHLQQTKTYSSEVLRKWIDLDLRLLRKNPAILNNFVMMQHWAYSSIALYEAVVPGMPASQTLSGQLNQMPSMPATSPGLAYHWPTAANAVLAAMTRNYYPSIPVADKASTDSLEAALNAQYQNETNAQTFQRSVSFGKQVAQLVYTWSLTDGSQTIHSAYVLPTNPGAWQRTPPGNLAPQNPFWGTNRPLMAGSVAASQLAPPPAYSTDPSSPFYAMAKEVYDLSFNLTDDQKEQVIFWRDVPGGGHAHWLAIFSQVLVAEGDDAMLDKAALVYVKMGITQSDARISCWKAKYKHNLLRPITYIRAVMNNASGWNSYITTPNHPEYPSAHSTFSTAASEVLNREFGVNYSFTDYTYDFLLLPPRRYSSFNHATAEAGLSRIYGGLHFRPAISAGNIQGKAVADYLETNINFKK